MSTTDGSHESYPIIVRTSNLRRFDEDSHIAWGCNPANVCYPTFSISFWTWSIWGAMEPPVCSQEGRHVSLQTLQFLALTETWITPEKKLQLQPTSQLPTHCHTHQDKQVKQENLESSSQPCGPARSFQWTTHPDLDSNSMLSLSPFLSNSILWQSIALLDLFDEMVALLSCPPDNGTPLVVLSDFKVHPEKLHSSEFINFFSTFDLTLSPSPPTHRARNRLDLVSTRFCST